ncbi:MAG: Rv3235 family protein [Propionibacteriaceae bacterium]|nr:Rv3235 family protein [Propionibacteriaceae bacterium]
MTQHHFARAAFILAQCIREALVGSRALHQVRPWLSPDAFEHLVSYTDTLRLRPGLLGAMRLQCPRADVAEATGTVKSGDRWLALCLRLELDETWRCSQLDLVGVA